jgi:hypothetical protein
MNGGPRLCHPHVEQLLALLASRIGKRKKIHIFILLTTDSSTVPTAICNYRVYTNTKVGRPI